MPASSYRQQQGRRNHGLNWIVRAVGDDRIVWHNGGTGGYRSFAGFDPAAGAGVYEPTPEFRITVTLEGGQLRVQAT